MNSELLINSLDACMNLLKYSFNLYNHRKAMQKALRCIGTDRAFVGFWGALRNGINKDSAFFKSTLW